MVYTKMHRFEPLYLTRYKKDDKIKA